jgi:hypothetical protein
MLFQKFFAVFRHARSITRFPTAKKQKTDAFHSRLFFLFEKNYCNLRAESIII